jgi:hypothetical protein
MMFVIRLPAGNRGFETCQGGAMPTRLVIVDTLANQANGRDDQGRR